MGKTSLNKKIIKSIKRRIANYKISQVLDIIVKERRGGSSRLRVVLRNASVDVNIESGGEINSGETKTSCDSLENPIPGFACQSHLYLTLNFQSRFHTTQTPFEDER
ncbi:hypothetical protein ACOSQ3_003680 [Xanthoceras sorbifolium]